MSAIPWRESDMVIPGSDLHSRKPILIKPSEDRPVRPPDLISEPTAWNPEFPDELPVHLSPKFDGFLFLHAFPFQLTEPAPFEIPNIRWLLPS